MKKQHRFLCFLLAISLAMLCAGCNNTTAKLNQLLPKGVKLGMLESEVIGLLGEPTTVVQISEDINEDIWENMQLNGHDAEFCYCGSEQEFHYISYLLMPEGQDLEQLFSQTLDYMQKQTGNKLIAVEQVEEKYKGYEGIVGDYLVTVDLFSFKQGTFYTVGVSIRQKR